MCLRSQRSYSKTRGRNKRLLEAHEPAEQERGGDWHLRHTHTKQDGRKSAAIGGLDFSPCCLPDLANLSEVRAASVPSYVHPSSTWEAGWSEDPGAGATEGQWP